MLIAPIPRVNESPKSLLNRYSTSNFFESVSVALEVRYEEALASSRFLFGDLPQVKAIALKLNRKLDVDMAQWFYAQKSGFTAESPVLWKGISIPYSFFIPSRARVCPVCIGESLIHQSADFSFFRTCTTHKLKLHDKCHSCSSPLGWLRGTMKKCRHCKIDLSTLPKIADDRPAEQTLLKWFEDGLITQVELTLKLLDSLKGFYSSQVIEGGILLEAVLQLLSGHVDKTIEILGNLYPVERIPKRLMLAPFFVVNELENSQLKDKLSEHIGGLHNAVGDLKHLKTQLRFEEVEFGLNISAVTRRKLQAEGFLSKAVGKHGYDAITMESINNILSIVMKQAVPADNSKESKSIPLGRTLISSLKMLKDKQIHSHPSDWSEGLYGIHVQSLEIEPKISDTHFLDIDEFAIKANTYPDAIRRAVHAGVVKADITPIGRKGTLFSIDTVSMFCSKYCFSTEIAKQTKGGRTIIGALLLAAGVKPISGPQIDGSLVPLYLRSDISKLDLHQLMQKRQFSSKSGRKSAGVTLYDKGLWVSSREMRGLFDLCAVELTQAVQAGLLEQGVPKDREADNSRYFVRSSVDKFRDLLSQAKLIDDFCEELMISKKEFQLRFIQSGFIEPLCIGKRRWVRGVDLPKVRLDCQNFVGLYSAGIITGAPPKHFRNLLNTHRIRKVSTTQTITASHFDLILRKDLDIHAVKAKERGLWAEVSGELTASLVSDLTEIGSQI